MNDSTLIWKATPSQLINTPSFILCPIGMIGGLIASMISPWFLLIAGVAGLHLVYRIMIVSNERYELSSERLKIYTGIFNQEINEIELYRIKDYVSKSNLFYRCFNLSNVKLVTSDRSHPEVTLKAIKNGVNVQQMMRGFVETLRSSRGVREID